MECHDGDLNAALRPKDDPFAVVREMAAAIEAKKAA
jgi:hypothetical protein